MSDTEHPKTNPCGPPGDGGASAPRDDVQLDELSERQLLLRLVARVEHIAERQEAQGETLATMASEVTEVHQARVQPHCVVGRAMEALRHEQAQGGNGNGSEPHTVL